MAELGESGRVRVAWLGKIKTFLQMIAIGFLLYGEPLGALPVMAIGRTLLVLAAALTIWSMVAYLKAAWPPVQKQVCSFPSFAPMFSFGGRAISRIRNNK